jgi:hypothetical protein
MSAILISPEKLQKIVVLSQQFSTALDSGDQTQIMTAQQALSAETEMDWEYLDQDPSLTPKDKALARILADMALKELPELVKDPANYPLIKSRMRLLKNSIVLLQ